MAKKIFDMFIFFSLSLWSGVFGGDAVKSESVTEGESVTLEIDDTTDNETRWRFGHKHILIALINRENGKRNVHDDALDGRFRGRLQLDQTGSLTITDTRTTDSGLYAVIGSRTQTPLNTFNLTVYARLSVPVISRNGSSPSSSEQSCSLLCSAVNIECVDASYSCVINNSISNQTTHLNTQLCKPCAAHICSCGVTEAVIRLALSALVGVAAVAVLVYDIRSRSLRQKREQTSPSSD
ncbi:uncharacterized protein LOC131535247 isoform X3 [Onychostoma macrolepis]|uniref:uncharacterized protein LOC131530801 n=1 Tax=Onychostoma macrolepis TaxID=369639 RepID=UPI002729CD97|nr:uncharacterized protein LOC131530801 [Onychostoma macrolepis]XP_058624183.1 uncharacterized protein LOC131535247 isoform X3 [Onychostoma macrolepis]